MPTSPKIHYFLLLLATILLLVITAAPAVAQRVEIPSSPNPVGSGARALGMGGAFIAVADDATAASWNPGGLIQLEKPEISIVVGGILRMEKNSFGDHPEANGTQEVKKADLNYFSAAYPFDLKGYNMIVSINYQKLYNFSRKWELDLNVDGPDYSEETRLDYTQTGDLSAMGLAYCVQIMPRLSLGLTFNVWNDTFGENGWNEHTNQSGSGMYDGQYGVFDTRRTDTYSFSGINANVGMLWQATGRITLGAVFKSPFTADLDHSKVQYNSFYFPDSETDQPTITSSGEALRLSMPMSYGIGGAFRFSDTFTASMDIYRTHWNDFKLEDETGTSTSPITGQPFDDSRVDPTVQVRLGAEYLFILPKCLIPLRGGIFYDPSPADGTPDDYYGVSMGSGLSLNRFSWDISGQYRFGRSVARAIMPGYDFSQDVQEYTVYTSVILYL